MSAIRFLAQVCVLLVLGAGVAAAQSTYYVYLDTDNDPASGCSVARTDSGTPPSTVTIVEGAEVRLAAAKGGGTQIADVVRETCDGGAFTGAVSVDGGYPVGLNNGLSGADVVELGDSLTGLGTTSGGTARLVFMAEDASGYDVLGTATGGGPVVVALPALTPSEIPGLGVAGTVVLVLALGGLAILVLRRRPGAAWTVVGLLVLTTAWAANFVVDGQVGDWAGEPQAGSDPTGDASNGADPIDIVGAFVATEGGRLFARIDVVDVENAGPTADATSASVLEDGGAVTVNLSGADPEGAPLSFAIDTTPGLGSLGGVTSTGPATATVDYTPDPDAFGADSFTYTVSDGSVTSAPATASITITPVNDAPTFTASDPPAVLEDAGPQTVSDFATFDPGAANESGQGVLAYTVSNVSNPGLFSAGPAVDNAGNLTYTPAAATTGTSTFDLTVQDDGGTANGGVDTSGVQTFTIIVDDVNGEPSFTAGADQTVLEDAGAQTVSGWATAIDDGDGGTQTLTFNITNNTNTALFAAGPAIDATTGDLTYTPAADANGSADITIELVDDGGTANGGDDTSAPATFTITVDPVNDAPSFTAGADQSVLEDAGAQTVAGWATGLTAGPSDESGQTLTFNVTNNTNASLFSSGPAIDPGTGDLTYTPAADASGNADITVELMDDGGTANGGVDTSPTQTFTITVDAVNDAPSFTSGGNVNSNEDAGAQSVATWATGISDGDGGTQNLSFNVTGNTNPGLFSVAPSVDPSTGNLTYTSALNANGSADITIELMDDGGTANGGNDTSAPASFTITINPINDPPQVTAPGPFSVTGNVRIQVTDGADDLLAGANDAADGGTALTVTAGSISSTQGGDVTLNADGTFDYDPPAGYEGADSFNFEVCDSGVPGSACTNATVNLNVSGMVWFVDSSASAGDGRLSSPFNDVDALDAVNDGSGDNPAAGEDIFLYTGTYDGQLTLLNNQRVFGEGATSSLAPMTGITLPAYSDPFPATGGTRPNWTVTDATALIVAQGNTLRGFNIGNTGTGTDIAGTSFGTLTVSELSLLGSGQALDLNTGTLAGTIGALTSTSGSRNVRLVNVGGSPTFGTGTLSGATNQAFFVDGGTGTFSYPGSISNTTNRVAEIRNKTGGGVTLSGNLTSNAGGTGILVTANSGGTYTFSGGTKTVNTGTNPGVTLSTNTGATISFTNGGLDIDTTSGTGFSAAGGGTVTVAGSGNTVTTSTGTAVDVANTSIGGSGLTWNAISSTGASGNTAISLVNSGAGAFEVTGSGSAGTGGTIDNKSADAVLLDNTGGPVTLRYMVIEDIGNLGVVDSEHDAIHGQTVNGGLVLDGMTIRRISDMGVHGAAIPSGDSDTVWNGLTITNSVIENTNRYHVAGEGDTSDEGTVRIRGLRGTVLVDGNTFQNGAEHLDLFATAGTLNLTATNNDFLETYKEFSSGTIASVGKICLDVTVQNAANATVVVGGSGQANSFRNCRIASVRVSNDSAATGTVTSTVANNAFLVTDHSSGSGGDFDFPMGGVKYSTRGAATAVFDGRIMNNTFTDVTNADGGVGNVTLDMDQGVVQVLVDGNTFHAPGNAAWFVRADATSSFELQFENNNYQRDAFPCTEDPSCGGGYFGPGLFNRVQVQNGAVIDFTMDNEPLAQHDTAFDPGNTVEVQVLNVGGGGTACASFTGNASPHGYALEESAGTLNLARDASGIGVPATCSGGAPANCVTVLDDNLNTGGGGNAAADPPTVSVFGTVDIQGTACALPSGSIF